MESSFSIEEKDPKLEDIDKALDECEYSYVCCFDDGGGIRIIENVEDFDKFLNIYRLFTVAVCDIIQENRSREFALEFIENLKCAI